MSKDKKETAGDLTVQDILSSILKLKVKHLLSLCVLILAIVVYIKFGNTDFDLSYYISKPKCLITTEKLKYRVYRKDPEINESSGHLKHVYEVLNKLGYEREHDPNSTNWDLLWAHDYPFRALYPQLHNLKYYQRVNHFPGCGYITNKVDLSTNQMKYILPAFKLPDQKQELLDYATKNPKKIFVQKSNNHRNIKIQKIELIDLDQNGTFIQEYVDKPFLVDGYKFDIGVYTIITSIDPLRIYIYNGEVLFRYCMHKYYPFDPADLHKYVVGDDYLPTWEVPSLKRLYTELNFSMRDSFDAYVRSQGKNPELMWEKIEDALRNVILSKEEAILNIVQRFKYKRNFFEMMRFDFIVDENLDVYLMEANMSPNLSSAHYPPNSLLYEQVLYNLFSLIGLAMRPHCCHEGQYETSATSAKSLSVLPDICNSELCKTSCVPSDCQICVPCLTEETKINLARAYLEHVNRKDCKRIFPPPMIRNNSEEMINEQLEGLSAENQLQYRWFWGKCLLDKSWCT